MEFSHRGGMHDFFFFVSSDTFDVFRLTRPMGCPGVTVEVYPGATHLSFATSFTARTHVRIRPAPPTTAALAQAFWRKGSPTATPLLPRRFDSGEFPLAPRCRTSSATSTSSRRSRESAHLFENFNLSNPKPGHPTGGSGRADTRSIGFDSHTLPGAVCEVWSNSRTS